MITEAGQMAGLLRKLSELLTVVERVPKRGTNEFHHYQYATEADINAAVRVAMAERSLMLIPAIIGESRQAVGEKGSVLTTLDMTLTWYDAETGASLPPIPWRGWGTDKEDKGGYKAITGALKYALAKTFLIPTGDDPERESAGQRKARENAIAKPDRNTKKDRPAVPEGVLYIERVEAKTSAKGYRWLNVVLSNGEDVVAPEQLESLLLQYVQANIPVTIECSLTSKGRAKLERVKRWTGGGEKTESVYEQTETVF